jgi:hypothetical protein
LRTDEPLGVWKKAGAGFGRRWLKLTDVVGGVLQVKYGGVDASHVQVGFLEVTHEGRRKSGVEAWSERIQYALVELDFHDFLQRFPTDEAVLPHVHQVKYVKEKGELVLSFQEHVGKGLTAHRLLSRRTGAADARWSR